MVMTAIDVEPDDRDALKARQAARIPAICKMLPIVIESRARTLRPVVASGFTDPGFKPTSQATVPVNSTARQAITSTADFSDLVWQRLDV